jgi:hypothetical protein
LPPAYSECQRLLDATYACLMGSREDDARIAGILETLFLGLHERRSAVAASDWGQLVTACRAHPLKGVLHEDPFTARAYLKPRGYAGDAVMMDYIYGREELWEPPQATALGRRIFEFTTAAPAADGVRARRAYMADVLDVVASACDHPDVLSIACGHLREAGLSSAVRRRKFGRFIGLDADASSLSEVQRCYGLYGMETVHARFRELLSNRLRLGRFDLVYSTGLLDYLAQAAGRRLTAVMFGLLRRGGRLIVANFMPGIRDVGYMEAFMDWQLIYRSRYDMLDLTAEIPQSQLADLHLIAEENQNILVLDLVRA